MPHLKILFISIGTLALTACVVAPYPAARYQTYAPDAVYGGDDTVINVAPPAPYTEVIPVAPYLDAVWIGGYWGWYGGRHVWMHGHYEHGRPGFVYHQAGWNRDGGGRYHFHRGGWGH